MSNLYNELLEMVIEENGKTAKQNFIESYNINNLKVYADGQNAYVIESDLFDFMKQNHIYSVTEAENVIAKIKSLDENSIVIMEAAPEKEAFTVKKAEKLFNDIIAASKTKTESIQDIDARIRFLKQSVKKMEDARDHVDGGKEHVKFVLKALIPFNGLARLVNEQHDVFGIFATIVAMFTSGVIRAAGGPALNGLDLVIRATTYKNMINAQIKKTNDAIDYLEKMKNTLK